MADEKNLDMLIHQAMNGNQRAFEELIGKHERLVYNIVHRMLTSPEDARDVAQEVFVKVYKGLAGFDGKSAFSTWIYRIAVNACLDLLRQQKNKQTLPLEDAVETANDPTPTPEGIVLEKEAHQEILQALNLLSEEHKTMIVLRDLSGLSYIEIAEAAAVSLGTVKSRLARARSQLRREILKIREPNTNSARLIIRKEGMPHEV